MKVIAKQNRELLLINAQNTQNENKAETLEIEVPEKFEDYNKKIVFDTDDGVVWDVITDNQYKITNAITQYNAVDFYIWLTKDDEDWRSKTKTLKFYDNKDASGEITPEEISGVNTVINLLEDEIDKVERLNITAEKVGKVTTLTITYKDGTEGTFEILDGNDGADGQDGEDYVITPEDYQTIANIVMQTISVPTKTSDLTNDSGFIDNTVSNLTNYYNKNQSYNKEEIDGKLSSIYKYKGTVATYSDLPSTDVRVGDVYNVEEDGSNYAWNGTEWDKLGGDVDLSNYYNKTQTDTLLNGKVDNSTLNDYYTKTRTDELLNTKVDKTTYNSKVEEIETELGEKIEESDLADYVKDTDYATSSKGGVIKAQAYGLDINSNGTLMPIAYNYSQYPNLSNNHIISKGTLENVIAGKQLINQTQLEESQTAQDELISELKEENKELYDAMAKVTGSGTDVTLNNTAKGKMPIEVSGNTEQEELVSPNIFNATQFLADDYWNRQYFQKGDDENTLIVNNVNYQNWTDISLIFADKIINGHTYFFSCEGASSIQINNATDINISGTTATFTANTEGVKMKIFASSYPATITKILLIDTTTYSDTSYHPYGTAPSPDWESPVKVVTGENTVKVNTDSYPLNLGSIELCKIGEYKDYIYKDNDKWYVHKMIGKAVLDGSESGWQYDTTYNYIRNSVYDFNGLIPANDSNQLSNYFKVEKTWITFRNTTDLNAFIPISNTGYKFAIRNTNCSSLAEYSTFFANYKPKFYYIVATPTDIEITNTTLINQLEAIYNTAKSYKGTTHIYTEVEEGNVAPILDATAIMDLNSLVQN